MPKYFSEKNIKKYQSQKNFLQCQLGRCLSKVKTEKISQ